MDRATDKLIQYIDGELSVSEAAEVAAQLKSDKALQAKHIALTRVDRLLTSAPMAEPSFDFAAAFEVRLDQHLNRRRNIMGLSIISGIMVLATALLLWSFASSGTDVWAATDGNTLANLSVDLLQRAMNVAGIIFRVGSVILQTMFQLVQHPIFLGYASLALGLVALWAQVLKWVGITRTSATA